MRKQAGEGASILLRCLAAEVAGSQDVQRSKFLIGLAVRWGSGNCSCMLSLNKG